MNKIPNESVASECSESEIEEDQDSESMEQVLANHTSACLDQRFTRLPCAAHKVMSKTFSE